MTGEEGIAEESGRGVCEGGEEARRGEEHGVGHLGACVAAALLGETVLGLPAAGGKDRAQAHGGRHWKAIAKGIVASGVGAGERVGVMSRGQMRAIRDAEQWTEDEVMATAMALEESPVINPQV